MDYLFWEHLKSKVYETKPIDINNLTHKILREATGLSAQMLRMATTITSVTVKQQRENNLSIYFKEKGKLEQYNHIKTNESVISLQADNILQLPRLFSRPV